MNEEVFLKISNTFIASHSTTIFFVLNNTIKNFQKKIKTKNSTNSTANIINKIIRQRVLLKEENETLQLEVNPKRLAKKIEHND